MIDWDGLWPPISHQRAASAEESSEIAWDEDHLSGSTGIIDWVSRVFFGNTELTVDDISSYSDHLTH